MTRRGFSDIGWAISAVADRWGTVVGRTLVRTSHSQSGLPASKIDVNVRRPRDLRRYVSIPPHVKRRRLVSSERLSRVAVGTAAGLLDERHTQSYLYITFI